MADLPDIKPDDLGALLRLLPEPDYADVSLVGDYDVSSAIAHAKGLFHGIGFRRTDRNGNPIKKDIAEIDISRRLDMPTNEQIFEIYRRSYGLKARIQAREDYHTQRGFDITDSWDEDINPHIDLREARWTLKDGVGVTFTPLKVTLQYHDHERSYTSPHVVEIRQALRGTGMPIRVHR